MKATQLLHELGQSLWLDNITFVQRKFREFLTCGVFDRREGVARTT